MSPHLHIQMGTAPFPTHSFFIIPGRVLILLPHSKVHVHKVFQHVQQGLVFLPFDLMDSSDWFAHDKCNLTLLAPLTIKTTKL